MCDTMSGEYPGPLLKKKNGERVGVGVGRWCWYDDLYFGMTHIDITNTNDQHQHQYRQQKFNLI